MNAVLLRFVNQSGAPFEEIVPTELSSISTGDFRGFEDVTSGSGLGSTESIDSTVHIDFRGKIQGKSFAIGVRHSKFPCKLAPPVGELLRPTLITHQQFAEKQSQFLFILNSI